MSSSIISSEKHWTDQAKGESLSAWLCRLDKQMSEESWDEIDRRARCGEPLSSVLQVLWQSREIERLCK